MSSLELVALEKRWPGLTVRVDLEVGDGRLLALAGPSGCGKSTVLRLCSGLTEPDGGRVMVGGNDVTALGPERRGIGMVFQDYALFPHLTARGNVEYGLSTHGVRRRARKAAAMDLLDAVGIAALAGRRPHELSGGERQRVALARTLAIRPAVILFDEPLSSLDATLRTRLRADIRDHQRRFGLTAVYVTHDIGEALAIADETAVMQEGRILQRSTPAELWSRPASAAVARILGSGPALRVTRVEPYDAGALKATTAGGVFLVPRTGAPEGGPLRVFFERNAAALLPQGAPAAPGSFAVRCERNDYLGDAVDCLVESGGERFLLRFPVGTAPPPGWEGRLSVAPGAAFLVPDDEVTAASPRIP